MTMGEAHPYIQPRGAPERPILEAAILLAAFYLPTYLPFASTLSSMDMARPPYHLALFALDIPRALLILYIMAASDGLTAFGLIRIAGRDAIKALFAASGALLIMLGAAYVFSAAGISNPLMAAARGGPRASIPLAPLALASCLTVGYCEELFFRSYLMRRLAQGGLPPLWAAIASSLVFGAGHGNQGIVGIVSGTLLGLFFAWRWLDGKDIHEVAIGHGLYDAAITFFAIYS
jgi:membrane protease YdiL (CAAX protease family)